jgi:anti-anti-sigma factor
MPEVSKVLVGSVEAAWVVKVLGRGTMEYCSDLFEFLSSRITPESPVDTVYFELSETTYLDSSFIGVIVSIQKKLQRIKGSDVIILNPSEKVKEILNTMGLFEILPIQENDNYQNLNLNQEIEQKLGKTYHDIQILLESHQNLMEVNTENRKRFSLVEEMLKKELERQKP